MSNDINGAEWSGKYNFNTKRTRNMGQNLMRIIKLLEINSTFISIKTIHVHQSTIDTKKPYERVGWRQDRHGLRNWN